MFFKAEDNCRIEACFFVAFAFYLSLFNSNLIDSIKVLIVAALNVTKYSPELKLHLNIMRKLIK